MSGRLVLVGTPIGNLGDLSPRAAEALGAADLIACEDTRRSGRLFELAGIERTGRFVAFDDHATDDRVAELVDAVRSGATVVVVSDAGMPGVSDPGERLVAAASAAGLTVEVVPGPSAVLTALVASGLPTGRFAFEGFLPRKGPARRERIAAIARDPRTTVLFESPHRVAATLADLDEALGGDRAVVVARELTKLHQELWRGTVADAAVHFAGEAVRGEVTLVVAGAPPDDGPSDGELLEALDGAVARGRSVRDAVDEVVEATGARRRRVYDLARGRDEDLKGE